MFTNKPLNWLKSNPNGGPPRNGAKFRKKQQYSIGNVNKQTVHTVQNKLLSLLFVLFLNLCLFL